MIITILIDIIRPHSIIPFGLKEINMIIEPKKLYVRVFQGKPVALFCVSSQVTELSKNFFGKVFAVRGTNSHSKFWYAHDQLAHMNEQPIFIMEGVTFREASDSDLTYILSRWNKEFDKPSRESLLRQLSTEILSFSELQRIKSLVLQEIEKFYQ